MIRPFTCVTVLMAFGSGLYLYQTKHQAQVLDRQIDRTVKEAAATRAQTRDLSTAWTLLGNPMRLQQLSDQFLGLKQVSLNQFVAMSDLDSRLPPLRGPDAPTSGPGMPDDADTEGTPVTMAPLPSGAAPPPPAQVPPIPVASAPAAPQAKPPVAAAAPRIADRKPNEAAHPPRDTVAHDLSPSRDLVATQDAPPARPIAPRAAPRPETLADLERPTPQRLPSAPIGGSLLGMAHGTTPPAPRPVSTAPYATYGN